MNDTTGEIIFGMTPIILVVGFIHLPTSLFGLACLAGYLFWKSKKERT